MKQFKIIFALFGFLSVFLLHGCGDGSKSASGQVGSISTEKNGSSLRSADNPLLTSFTLYGTKGDANTAIAGEISGNSIIVQVPSDTTFPLQIDASFRAADPDGRDIIKISESKYGPQSITNDTPQIFVENTPVNYTVETDDGQETYTILVVKRAAYFTQYADTICIRDFDGNIWYKFMDPNNWVSWSTAVSHAEQLNTGYFKTGTCGLTSNWGLPSKSQMQLMINYLPLDNRKNPTQIGGISPEATWFNSQGFMVSGFNLWGQSDENDNTKAYVWNLDGVTYHQTPLGISTVDKNSTNMVVSTWFVNSTNKNDAKTITDFSVENQPAVIVGNKILLNTPIVLPNPEHDVQLQINFTATTGGAVIINNASYSSGSKITLTSHFTSQEQTRIVPVTVISNNGEKNIYTLVVKFVAHIPTPAPTPPLVNAFYVCTASDSPFSGNIVATVGNNEFPNKLPEPGQCGTINLGSTKAKDLLTTPALWWSVDNMKPVGAPMQFANSIPTFQWQPSNSPSGYSLSVETKPSCSVNIVNGQPVGTDGCFTANKPVGANVDTGSPGGININVKLNDTDPNSSGEDKLQNSLKGDWSFDKPNNMYTFSINNYNVSAYQWPVNGIDYRNGVNIQSPLNWGGVYTLAGYASTSSKLALKPTRSDPRCRADSDFKCQLPTMNIPFSMVAEIKYCRWNIELGFNPHDFADDVFSVSNITKTCQFPSVLPN
jgi:hypothetical protein